MQALAHDTDEELTDDSRPLDALMSDASMEEEGRGGLPVFKTIMGREIQGAADVDASWFSMSQFRAVCSGICQLNVVRNVYAE